MRLLALRAQLLLVLLAGTAALRLLSLARRVAATACIASCLILPEANADVSDILQGATSAMMTGKERAREEKDFNALPPSAQKRAALNAWYDASFTSDPSHQLTARTTR